MPLCDGLQATKELRAFEEQQLRATAAAAEKQHDAQPAEHCGGGTGQDGGARRHRLKIIGLTANASEEDRRAR